MSAPLRDPPLRAGPRGAELHYLAPDGTLMAAPMAVMGATLEPGRAVALFRTRIVGGGTDLNLGVNYDIARDGLTRSGAPC